MQLSVIHCSFFRPLWLMSLCLGPILPTFSISQSVPGRYLKEVLPCNGCEVSTLYPVIQWPVKKGKNINYDVELDRDTLPASSPILYKSALPYSILIPYIPLNKGIYYWRYKVNGLQWSPYFYFSIKEDYKKNIPPDPVLFLSKIPEGHPRLLINNMNQSRSIDAKNEDRIAIISEADELLLLSLPGESIDTSRFANLNENQKGRIEKDAAYQIGYQAYQRIYLFCQAYLLTGNEKNKKAIRHLLTGDWEINMVTETDKEPLFELMNTKTGTYFNMFGNKTEWSAKLAQDLMEGNSYLLEKDQLNNLKHTTNGDFNKE